MKKILLSIGSAAAIVAPVSVALSCGSKSAQTNPAAKTPATPGSASGANSTGTNAGDSATTPVSSTTQAHQTHLNHLATQAHHAHLNHLTAQTHQVHLKHVATLAHQAHLKHVASQASKSASTQSIPQVAQTNQAHLATQAHQTHLNHLATQAHQTHLNHLATQAHQTHLKHVATLAHQAALAAQQTANSAPKSKDLFANHANVKSINDFNDFKDIVKTKSFDLSTTSIDQKITDLFKNSRDIIIKPGKLDQADDPDKIYGKDDIAILIKGTPSSEQGNYEDADSDTYFDVENYPYSDSSSDEYSLSDLWDLDKDNLANVSNIIYLQKDGTSKITITMNEVVKFDDTVALKN